MQTGNIFAMLGVVDPDGDSVRITHWHRPGIGKVSMNQTTGTGDFVPTGGDSDTVLNVMPNGDFSFNPGSAKTGRYGPQECNIIIDYTDDHAANHTADGSPDQIGEVVRFQFDGDLPENSAPPALTGAIVYVPDA